MRRTFGHRFPRFPPAKRKPWLATPTPPTTSKRGSLGIVQLTKTLHKNLELIAEPVRLYAVVVNPLPLTASYTEGVFQI
jgi:hypothetical protein